MSLTTQAHSDSNPFVPQWPSIKISTDGVLPIPVIARDRNPCNPFPSNINDDKRLFGRIREEIYPFHWKLVHRSSSTESHYRLIDEERIVKSELGWIQDTKDLH
ncbi:hypothetical protein TNCV_4830511 [Trichonephila clavipes]|nr:hypothetical protein TNCV_4830511 [Trichonephila clavipes]